jgi:CRP-like cAMP-binding protein
MSDLVEVPRGLRLFTEGAHGDELFVVIAGELAASTERDGRRVDLSRSQRGDVVGEIALFHGTRTADVDVVADARLLRFDEADLERLARRYPRIATRVYRNLNRIIASRVVSTARALR